MKNLKLMALLCLTVAASAVSLAAAKHWISEMPEFPWTWTAWDLMTWKWEAPLRWIMIMIP